LLKWMRKIGVESTTKMGMSERNGPQKKTDKKTFSKGKSRSLGKGKKRESLGDSFVQKKRTQKKMQKGRCCIKQKSGTPGGGKDCVRK